MTLEAGAWGQQASAWLSVHQDPALGTWLPCHEGAQAMQTGHTLAVWPPGPQLTPSSPDRWMGAFRRPQPQPWWSRDQAPHSDLTQGTGGASWPPLTLNHCIWGQPSPGDRSLIQKSYEVFKTVRLPRA